MNLAAQDQLRYRQLTINPVLSVAVANGLSGASSTTITAISNGNVYSGSIIKSVLHMLGVTASGQNNCVPYAVWAASNGCVISASVMAQNQGFWASLTGV